MDTYQPNRACCCMRCRTRGIMGPVILVTLGLLFLLSEWHVASFGRTWPVVLIAIGVVKVLGSSADIGGHIQEETGTQPPPPAPPAQTQGERPEQVEHV